MSTETNETTETTQSAETITAPTSKTSSAGADISSEELMKRYDNAVSDNVKYREERKGYQKQIADFEAEKGKVAEQLEAKDNAANERVAKTEFRTRLRHAGIDNANALKLLDLSEVTFDADGDIANADDVWTKFQEANPYLFGGNVKVSDTKSTSVHTAPSPKVTPIDWMTVSKEERAKIKPSQLNK